MKHYIKNHELESGYPEGTEVAIFGMGCFWGAEKKFWELMSEADAIHITAVGYTAGNTTNPNYKDVCTGTTNHNEVVLVAFNPTLISYDILLKTFWENHNPTQGMRQGNDKGTQYRSGVYTTTEDQYILATQSKEAFQQALENGGLSSITTEILEAATFYFAEEYHQQYLAKNPQGYCGLGGTGIHL